MNSKSKRDLEEPDSKNSFELPNQSLEKQAQVKVARDYFVEELEDTLAKVSEVKSVVRNLFSNVVPAPANENSDPFKTREIRAWIDKTGYLHKMLDEHRNSKGFFLLRPRRFGKTAFLNVIKHFYEDRDSFKNLNIGKLLGEKWESDERFLAKPVIHLQMQNADPKIFNQSLVDLIRVAVTIAEEQIANSSRGFFRTSLNTHESEDDYKAALSGSIPNPQGVMNAALSFLKELTGQSVVVLVDEFDICLRNCISAKRIPDDLVSSMKNFYGSFKDKESIEFVFMTGSTPLDPDMWSGLNNFTHLSFRPGYDGICGISIKELTEDPQYSRLLESVCDKLVVKGVVKNMDHLLKELQLYYNGYSWSGEESVLNTHSINKFLNTLKFACHWENTGDGSILWRDNPSAFDALLKICDESEPKFQTLRKISIESLAESGFKFTEEMIATAALLSGYLTVDEWKCPDEDGEMYYREVKLKVPNQSIRTICYRGLLSTIAPKFHQSQNDLEVHMLFKSALANPCEKSFHDFANEVQSLFSLLSYGAKERTVDQYEAYYQRILFIIFKCALPQAAITTEQVTSNGRVDLLVKYEKKALLIECKRHDRNKLNLACENVSKQVIEGGYLEVAAADRHAVIVAAICFTNRSVHSFYFSTDRCSRWECALDKRLATPSNNPDDVSNEDE